MLQATERDARMRQTEVPPGKDAMPKLFVLDTNVILHDSQCMWHFQENDLVVPITVLEELDRFKRGTQEINYHAREFLRQLDELVGDVLDPRGASLGEGRGSIRVVLDVDLDPELKKIFTQDCPDHRILSCTRKLSNDPVARYGREHHGPAGPVVLVTKDTNLRMKAKSVRILAQDYTTDRVEGEQYTGKRLVEHVPSDLVRTVHEAGELAEGSYSFEPPPLPNENMILRNGSLSALVTYHAAEQRFVRVEKPVAFGIKPRNAEQTFALQALLDDSIRLVTLSGRAGTGKTLLALAAALECRSRYRQILLARPIVPLSNRDLGFLPGDIDAKIDPYMQPLYDNLSVIAGESQGERDTPNPKVQQLLESKKLDITPLSYIRGRSLQRVFFIVDEAQNLTPHEVKTVITRAAEGTKMVFTGDPNQIDHPYLDARSNGISYLTSKMKGQSLFAHVSLEKGERSELAELASELL